jgi:metal iron transporter
MNCPSRNDETIEHEDWNQSPPALAADATTRQDMIGLANSRVIRIDGKASETQDEDLPQDGENNPNSRALDSLRQGKMTKRINGSIRSCNTLGTTMKAPAQAEGVPGQGSLHSNSTPAVHVGRLRGTWKEIVKFSKFVGPGFLVAVAYIDPGNYSTDVAAGATYKFRLLFIVLLSNLFAIFLQSLCVKLGSVTGLNLAENCKAHLPGWLNIVLYLFAEAAIIATDIAEVGITHTDLTLMLTGSRSLALP